MNHQDFKDYTCDEINAELEQVLDEIAGDDEQIYVQLQDNNAEKRKWKNTFESHGETCGKHFYPSFWRTIKTAEV